VCLTERRAIENYLSDGAIKAEKGSGFAALAPFQKLNHAAMPWAKHENWRIASRMTLSDIEQTDVGRFLAQL
jgi:hypothetical protein